MNYITQPFLNRNYRELSESEKVRARKGMDGSNFDCNKCGKIILFSEAECLMGGAKGEIPDICYEYGAVCKECYENRLPIK